MNALKAGMAGLAGTTLIVLAGCAFVAGGAAVGGAYEYQQHEAMQSLEAERRAGDISQEEYERRREEIQRRSVVQ